MMRISQNNSVYFVIVVQLAWALAPLIYSLFCVLGTHVYKFISSLLKLGTLINELDMIL